MNELDVLVGFRVQGLWLNNRTADVGLWCERCLTAPGNWEESVKLRAVVLTALNHENLVHSRDTVES